MTEMLPIFCVAQVIQNRGQNTRTLETLSNTQLTVKYEKSKAPKIIEFYISYTLKELRKKLTSQLQSIIYVSPQIPMLLDIGSG